MTIIQSLMCPKKRNESGSSIYWVSYDWLFRIYQVARKFYLHVSTAETVDPRAATKLSTSRCKPLAWRCNSTFPHSRCNKNTFLVNIEMISVLDVLVSSSTVARNVRKANWQYRNTVSAVTGSTFIRLGKIGDLLQLNTFLNLYSFNQIWSNYRKTFITMSYKSFPSSPKSLTLFTTS